jgi:lipopolysaccharide/colanic/teichoic acid biosynthesis glycosyltransferase
MRRFYDHNGELTVPVRPRTLQRVLPTTSIRSSDLPTAGASGVAPTGSPGGTPMAITSTLTRRVLDVSIALAALIVLSPLMAVIALLIRRSSPGPALFRQERIGYHERPFIFLKFRTMYTDCDDRVHRDYVTRMLTKDPLSCQQDGLFKLADDPRITRLGAFLRSTSLDELPQLINVLHGDMSLVGPRPALPWEVSLYKHHHYRMRFQVRPGITGLWQVRGRSKLSMNEALELDVQYAKRRSLAMDLWILLMTIPAVIARDQAR